MESVQLAGKAIVVPYAEHLAAVLIDRDIKTVSRGRLYKCRVGNIIGCGDIETEHAMARVLAFDRGLQLVERKHRVSRLDFRELWIQRLVDRPFENQKGTRSSQEKKKDGGRQSGPKVKVENHLAKRKRSGRPHRLRWLNSILRRSIHGMGHFAIPNNEDCCVGLDVQE